MTSAASQVLVVVRQLVDRVKLDNIIKLFQIFSDLGSSYGYVHLFEALTKHPLYHMLGV